MNRQPAHHHKLQDEDRYSPRLQELLRAHRMRQAYVDLGWFVPRDPRTQRARLSAFNHFSRELASAFIFLGARAARKRDAHRTLTRGRMQLLAGGRR